MKGRQNERRFADTSDTCADDGRHADRDGGYHRDVGGCGKYMTDDPIMALMTLALIVIGVLVNIVTGGSM
nr:MAG TPA: hypothetical protein [Caudoviricetes sp.]